DERRVDVVDALPIALQLGVRVYGCVAGHTPRLPGIAVADVGVASDAADELQQLCAEAVRIAEPGDGVALEPAEGGERLRAELGAFDDAAPPVGRVDDDAHAAVACEVLDGAAHGLGGDARLAGQLSERAAAADKQVQHDEARVGEADLVEAFAPALFDEPGGDGQQPSGRPVLDPIAHANPPPQA